MCWREVQEPSLEQLRTLAPEDFDDASDAVPELGHPADVTVGPEPEEAP